MQRLRIKNDAFMAIVAQIFTLGALTPVIAGGVSPQAALSFLLGGLVCVLPNLSFYRIAFAYTGARSAKKIMNAFYWGESVKMLLTGLGFVGAFKIAWGMPVWLFIGYIGAQGGFFFGPAALACWRMRKIS